MEQYQGKSIVNGIAIGKINILDKKEQSVKRQKVDDVEHEVKRYDEAKSEAIKQLNKLYEKALREVGEMNAQIFEVHSMMLEDDDYNDSVYNIIRSQSVNAEYAVAITGNNFSNMFSEMEDEYFKARAVDIKDISERVIEILKGGSLNNDLSEPAIIVAMDLAPSETVQLDKDKLLAFVTQLGTSNSHTAILARMMNIPAIIGVEINEEWNGKMAIVDGNKGIFIIDPDEDTVHKYSDKKQEEIRRKELLLLLKGKENVTADGRHIDIFANISNVSNLASVLENDAGGIGLFRSEFLFLGKDDYPSEEEQFHAYKQVAETMAGKKVIIRTLDIGADKQAEYFGIDKEENPAMGYRAIRICLTRKDIFKTQLRAIYRASAYGNVAVMYPMIISKSEIIHIKEIVDEVKAELDSDGITYGSVTQGIMIETPAAALMSDELAKEVDFFSIGTNDLTQYTLAIDRQNVMLDSFYDAKHPAVIRLIEMIVSNAHEQGIWVGICGELGADLSLTERFLEIGVDELSVSPALVLPIREKVRMFGE